MAGDISIRDKITGGDIHNLKSSGVGVVVKVDMSHAKEGKPLHLDIELDFSRFGSDRKSILQNLSRFKQRCTSTFGKFRFGDFAGLSGDLKQVSAKYEVRAFGGSVIADARNAHALHAAIQEARSGVRKGMMEVKY